MTELLLCKSSFDSLEDLEGSLVHYIRLPGLFGNWRVSEFVGKHGPLAHASTCVARSRSPTHAKEGSMLSIKYFQPSA